MRLIRSLTTGLALVVLLPVAGRAQQGKLFNNSWFWGVGAGTLTYWTSTTAHAEAPSVSLDWLITRSHMALLVGFDQTFFNSHNVTYTDRGRLYQDTTLTNFYDVAYYAQATIRNSRHITASLMAFPGHGPIRPYVGVGISANFVQGSVTTSAAPNLSPAAQWFPNYYGTQFRDQAANWVSPIVTAGLQLQLSRFSVYGQGKLFPISNNPYAPYFFTDQGFFELQAGIRVNVASLEHL
jgi:hypothetical protein